MVDDDAGIRNALGRLLRVCDFDVRMYSSAEEFLAHAGIEGCLILDIEMPGMSGLELQQVLAQRGARWQIIFISGRYDLVAAARQPALDAGAVAVLEKPADAREILAAIEVALARQGAAPSSGPGEAPAQ